MATFVHTATSVPPCEHRARVGLAVRDVCAIFVRGSLSSMIVRSQLLLLWCWFLQEMLTTIWIKPMYRTISSGKITYTNWMCIYH